MDKTKSLRSQALDLLRFPLACVVVTIHIFAGTTFSMHGVVTDLQEYGCLMAAISFCKAFLAGQSVPIYFFIAGYVFFSWYYADQGYLSEKDEKQIPVTVCSLHSLELAWNSNGFAPISSNLTPVFPRM